MVGSPLLRPASERLAAYKVTRKVAVAMSEMPPNQAG